MFLDPYKLIEKLNELELSAEQFCFAYFIYLTKEKQVKFNSAFGLYYENNKDKYDYIKIINELEELNYIENGNRSNSKYDFDKIVFTDKFKNLLFVSVDEAWNQVLSEYPLKLNLGQGKIAMLQGTKNPQLKQYYYEQVIKGGDRHLHLEFLALTNQYYKGEKTVSQGCGLEKYLYSWQSMRLLILDEVNGKSNNTEIIIN
jgi:hypothetical protein